MRVSDQALDLPYLEVGGELNLCFINVPEQVAREGGKAVWGWRCLPEVGGLIEHQAGHCVWESPDGVLWEITPQGWLCGHQVGVLRLPSRFIPDDAVRQQFEAAGEIGLIGRYRPLHPSPKVLKLCDLMQREQAAWRDGDVEKHRYWNKRVNDIANQFGFHVDPVA